MILASGPSLSPEQVHQVAQAWAAGRCRVIAINTTFRLAPWADVLYACDGRWWQAHPDAAAFTGRKVIQDVGENGQPGDQRAIANKVGGFMVRSERNEKGQVLQHGLGLTPGCIRTGQNSGYQALNLAVQLGAARILLLGFDMKLGPGGQKHWHGNHPPGCDVGSPFPSFREAFATLVAPLKALGVEVLNCTPGSALGCFPRAALEEVL